MTMQTISYKKGYIFVTSNHHRGLSAYGDIIEVSYTSIKPVLKLRHTHIVNSIAAAKRWITQRMQDDEYIPHYSDKHPKLDVYSDGVYKGSTNWYPTIRLCKRWAVEKWGGYIEIVKSN